MGEIEQNNGPEVLPTLLGQSIRETKIHHMVYQTIVADPPWGYHGQQEKWGAAAKFYKTMPDNDILSLPIAKMLDRHGVLFLWATCPRLDFAIRCIESWGLHYRGVAFVWIKTAKDGKPFGARGVRPSITKPITELVLAASHIERGRPLPLADESIVQTVFAPLGEHSAKPDIVQDRIELMYPKVNRLELFARRERPGWDCWGDQSPNVNLNLDMTSTPD